MISLVQRVLEAEVRIQDDQGAWSPIASIGCGLLVLVGVERDDAAAQADALAERLINFRVFDDEHGRMNLDVGSRDGELLLVSQFTLAADTRKGRRPGFSTAAAPEMAEPLFDHFVAAVRARHPRVGTGRFGAEMRVALVNDGPVTFRLDAPPVKG